MKWLLIAGSALVACTNAAEAPQFRMARADATFPGDVQVSLEVAATEEERQRGLMFRDGLAPDEGMIFVFPEPGANGFWMKNTLIPLDMFWLESDGRIVAIRQSVPPCGNKSDRDFDCPIYEPGPAASSSIYVIETAAGFAKQHGIEVGDTVALEGMPIKR
ncbi:MAG: DUF192 domain-containing protein [Luteitalea sp.]|nr:DUF192 domain-containing protein [Luteitalea sp.]